ncbi:MAG TPA: DUF4349 domain-containing protein [Blastocatellia bacterium]|nr:DUF4349 domain-containing protein [Blastocatellia bacterium]
MKRHKSIFFAIAFSIISLLLNTGCNTRSSDVAPIAQAEHASDTSRPQAAKPETQGLVAGDSQSYGYAGNAQQQGKGRNDVVKNVSLSDPPTGSTQPDERRIIRNAEFTINAKNPGDAQHRISAIAESHGGFVVKSEVSKSSGESQDDASYTAVTVVIRVPASHFAAAIDEIRGGGNRIVQENITGLDVTEEYIDLEARVRTKKALEAQFLDILKQARSVSDALEVQSQIADVRTEIERMEGRRRFLENQSALSTITVTLKPFAPVVAAASTPGFFSTVKQSLGDAADMSIEIVLGIIRLVILLIPVVVLVFLPCYFVIKFLIARFRSASKSQSMPTITNPETIPGAASY